MNIARVVNKYEDWLCAEDWDWHPIITDFSRFGITVPKSVKCPDGYTEIDYYENKQDWEGLTSIESLMYLPYPNEEKDYKIIIIPGDDQVLYKESEGHLYTEFDELLGLLDINLEHRDEELFKLYNEIYFGR
jgi:hypothetical protein